MLSVVIILYSESWLQNGINLPCQELAAEGVVVVTIAYRLNILSFFTLNTLTARGNLALLDQYMAFLWVRENIAAFGGDSNSITLLGHSAGADSVLLHIASPRAIGLFHRAVIMSPQNIWKAIGKQTSFNSSTVEMLSQRIVEFLGCSSNSLNDILQCMKTKSLTDIMALNTANWTNGLQPTPDNFLPESEQYLPDTLSSTLSSSKSVIALDVLLGTTDLEAINQGYKYEELLKEDRDNIFDNTISILIPNLLKLLSLDRLESSTLVNMFSTLILRPVCICHRKIMNNGKFTILLVNL